MNITLLHAALRDRASRSAIFNLKGTKGVLSTQKVTVSEKNSVRNKTNHASYHNFRHFFSGNHDCLNVKNSAGADWLGVKVG